MSLSLVEDLEQECLICLKSTLPKQQGDPKYQEEVFNRFLEIFNVNLSPFKWNFTTEGTPFCSNCSYGVSQLIELHEKLQGIQNDIEKEIHGIKLKLTVSEKHKKSNQKDVRAIIFRGQILGNSVTVIEPSPKISHARSTPQKWTQIPLGQPMHLGSELQDLSLHPRQSNINNKSNISQGKTNYAADGLSSECREPPELEPFLVEQREGQKFEHLIRFEAVGDVNVKGNTISTNIPVVYQQSDNQNDFVAVAAHEIVIEEPCDDYGDEYHDTQPDEDPDPDYILPHENEEKKVQVARIGDRVLRVQKKSYKDKTTKSQESVTAKKPRVTITQKSKCKDGKIAETVKRKRIRKNMYKPKPRAKKQRRARTLTPSHVDEDGREFIDKYEILFLPEREGYKCGDCGETFAMGSRVKNRQKLLDHIRGIHLGLFKCTEPGCDKAFQSSASLSSHFFRYHTVGQVECDICGKPIMAVVSLPFHKWLHMNKEEQEAARAAGKMPSKAIRIENQKKSYICRFCGKCLSRASTLKQHELTHTTSVESRNFVCPICKKCYSARKNLIAHRRKYCISNSIEQKMKWKKFACTKCDKKFRCQSELTFHARYHLAKEEKPFACSICDKRFSTEKYTSDHESRVHSSGETPEDFPYPCSICGQRFRIKKYVQWHMRYHPEQKKEMLEQSRLARVIIPELEPELSLNSDERAGTLAKGNLQKKADQDQEKSRKGSDKDKCFEEFPPFVENDNGELAYRNIKLTKIDKGYTCGFCSKDFCDVEFPDTAIKTHINGCHFGMYKCDVCQKYCSSKSHLKSHKRSHKQPVKITCNTCGILLVPRNLAFHEWTHMTEEQKEALIASGDYSKVPLHIRRRRNLKFDKETSCKYCNEKFSTRKEWRVHCRTNHPEEWSQQCREKFKQNRRRAIVYSSSENDEGEDEIPNNSDADVETLKTTAGSSSKHSELLQNPEKFFKCSICLKRLRDKEHLDKHTAKVHTPRESVEDYTYSCAICGQRFKTKNSWTLHHRKNHKGKRKQGDLNTLQPELVDEDVKDKGEEYPPFIKNDDGDLTYRDIKITRISGGYNCGFCGANIRNKDAPDRSIRLHINGVHFGFYRCDICQKYLPTKHSLREHKKDHKQVPCKVCKKLCRKRNLKFHEWVHLTEEEKESVLASGDYSTVPLHIRKQRNVKLSGNRKATVCKYCDMTLPTVKEYWKHCQANHPGQHYRKHYYKQSEAKKRRVTDEDDYSESDTSESDNQSTLSYEIEPDSDVDFKFEPVHFQDTSIKPFRVKRCEEYDEAQNGNDLSVAINRLPESVLHGKNFKVCGDSVTYTWNGRTTEISILEHEKIKNESNLKESDKEQEIYAETGYYEAEESFSDSSGISDSDEDSDQ